MLLIFVLLIAAKSFTQNTLPAGRQVDLVDKRALKIYTMDQINEMPYYKILQINYLYISSYIIPDEMKGVISPADIDMTQYFLHRKEKERVTVDLGINGEKRTGKYIILLSFQEVNLAFKDIENNNCNNKK